VPKAAQGTGGHDAKFVYFAADRWDRYRYLSALLVCHVLGPQQLSAIADANHIDDLAVDKIGDHRLSAGNGP
jgi:hypothetical protein